MELSSLYHVFEALCLEQRSPTQVGQDAGAASEHEGHSMSKPDESRSALFDAWTVTAAALVRPPSKDQPDLRWKRGTTGLIGRWMSHPWSMLVIIPGLMLLAGGSLIGLSRLSLEEENGQNWRDRLGDDSATIAESASQCLAQAYPLLQAIATSWEYPDYDPERYAKTMASLLAARPGVSALSVIDEHGMGLRVIKAPGPGGVRFEHYSPMPVDAQASATFRPPADELVVMEGKEQRLLDLTEADQLPHWSAPYRSLRSGQMTLCCAQAMEIHVPQPERGMAMVEFNARGIARVINGVSPHSSDSKPFIFTASGEMLVAPAAPAEQGSSADSGPRGFADALAQLPGPGEVRFLDHSNVGLPVLAAIRQIDLRHGPVLYASMVAPITSLAASTKRLVHTSLLIELAAVLGAALVGLLLTRLLTRQRMQVLSARAKEQEARERLEALGSYTLIKRLGSGGMGDIWQAEHHLLARPAALKLISLDAIAGTSSERELTRVRFAREARATASLRSPNTVTVYDFGFTRDGSFFYAMELLDGFDLERLVALHGAQPPGRVIRILMQVCHSLAEAHQNGLVHRDIKPANIYLCRLGLEVDVAKVLDFGLVADRQGADRASSGGIIQGTPAYMAPEQAKGLPTDARSDLYALGGVAYWLLSGHTVFDEDDSYRMLQRQINDPPAHIALAAGKRLPKDLGDLVMALLSKEADRRPLSALAVIATLQRIPLDDQLAWSETQAQAWWAAHQPAAHPPAAIMQESRTATIRISEPLIR